ncbi:hypothetical protein ASG87_12370 [Frateuria sp. Soil773]|uniref:hypothetical protein n=1 Tax=Frateuria sp. Soil773 TaxID=1736407 RepID=UPI0007023872|nr:hypothetical protein [Frateuria sp. Soil773]KRF01196.1 hypothetical protein ASG87_12370 [Frateuria sp. Soil773]
MPRSRPAVSARRASALAGLLLAALLAAGGAVGLRRHASAAEAAVAAPADDDSGGVAILLGLAGTAVREKRLVAPAGSNAYEFYLSVLQLEPDNRPVQDALRQLFPAATAEVERAINALELDEAQRELRLLREFDSTNFTLSLLGGKLDAQRQIVIRQDEERAAIIQAQAAAAAR